MSISESKKSFLSLDVIGSIVMYLYVLTNYVAQDIIISAYVNSLFLYLFLGIVLFKAISMLKTTLKLSPFIIWYILFALFSLVVMLYSPSFSLFSGTFYAILISLALIFSFQLYVTKGDEFKRLAWCYAISGAATVLMLLVTGNLKGSADDRLGQETFGNANIFASLMMIAAIYTIWLAVYTKGTAKKMISVIFIFADMYALALSGGRKFFVIPFLFLYILLLFKKDRKGRVHVVKVTLIFTVIVIALWIAIMKIPFLYESIGIRMEGLIETFSGEGGDYSSRIREDLRQAAMDEWSKAPLFGYGLDSFKYYARDNLGHFYYSHCNYTELLYSGGIIYFVLYYAMFAKIFLNVFRKKTLAVPYRAFAIAVPICLFIFDFGAVSFNSSHNLIMLLLAYKCQSFESEENTTGDQKNE